MNGPESSKILQKDNSEEQHCVYKEGNKDAKRAVAMAKSEAYYEDLYTKLDTREEAEIIYKLAKADTEEVDIYRT